MPLQLLPSPTLLRPAAHNQPLGRPRESQSRHLRVCRAALAVVRFHLPRGLAPPLLAAQAVLVLVVARAVLVLVVARPVPADQIVVRLALPVLLVPQVLPVLPAAPQVLVLITFLVVQVVATLPVLRYRVPVFLAQPLVAAVDLVVPVVVDLVAVVEEGALVLSSAKADRSVGRRLKS